MIQHDYKETEPMYRASFFDYWHYDNLEITTGTPSKKVAEKIKERIRMQEVYNEFPEHCIQLLDLLG